MVNVPSRVSLSCHGGVEILDNFRILQRLVEGGCVASLRGGAVHGDALVLRLEVAAGGEGEHRVVRTGVLAIQTLETPSALHYNQSLMPGSPLLGH